MTRMVTLSVGIIGMAVLVGAQTTNAPGAVADHVERISPTSVEFRGHVRLSNGSTVITADEADLTIKADGGHEYDLRGDVHLSVPPRK